MEWQNTTLVHIEGSYYNLLTQYGWETVAGRTYGPNIWTNEEITYLSELTPFYYPRSGYVRIVDTPSTDVGLAYSYNGYHWQASAYPANEEATQRGYLLAYNMTLRNDHINPVTVDNSGRSIGMPLRCLTQ